MKVNQEHWNAFMDFVEIHPQIITNKFVGPTGRSEASALWFKVTALLNSLGHGTKTVDEWRKAVSDWKCKVKAKSAKLKKDIHATGGGEAKYPPLNKVEERLLGILGRKGIDGDNVVELGILEKTAPGSSVTNGSEEKETKVDVILKHTSEDCPPDVATPTTSSQKRVFAKENYFDLGSKRRKIESPNVKRKDQQLNHLIQMNSETLMTLQSIDQNVASVAVSIASIAESLKIITDAVVEL